MHFGLSEATEADQQASEIAPTSATEPQLRMTNSQCKDLEWRDPLLRWLKQRSIRITHFAIVVGVVHLIIHFAAGWWTNNRYPSLGFTRATDPVELVTAMFLWGIAVPCWWFYYLWLPEGMLATIKELETSGVISSRRVLCCSQTTRDSGSSLTALQTKWVQVVNQNRFPLFGLAVSVIATILWISLLSPQEAKALMGQPSFWFIDPITFWLLITIVLINGYIFLTFVLRTMASVAVLTQFFSEEDSVLAVHPLAPDGCGGFGALGSYSLRLGLMAVLMGCWATWFTFVFVVGGGPPRINIVTLPVYLVYVVAVPTCLAAPLWSAHLAMQRLRAAKLAVIARQLELVSESALNEIGEHVTSASGTGLAEIAGQIESLQAMYQFILASYPVWPISFRAVRVFGFVASVPLWPTIISSAVEIAIKLATL